MSNYGIPYMGSKATVIPSIAMNFPPATHFYDLFGGGFSVTHYMLEHKAKRYSQFHYNEINADIVTLVKAAINGDFNYDKFKPEWISRQDFFAKKDSDAYVRICWSFGNDQTSYLFGTDIEEYKKSMHMAVIFDTFDDIASTVFGFNMWPQYVDTVIKKRYFLRQKIEYFRTTKTIPKILHKFIKQLQRLEQLEQLLQSERLQRLQRLERLEMSHCDYRKVEILPDSIVYCDIPYKGTKGYLNDFNHAEFFNWAASRDFPVYISEYNISDTRFECIYQIDKRSLLTSQKHKTQTMQEKLYWNKK